MKSIERKREHIDHEAAAVSDIIHVLNRLGSWRASRRVLFTVMMRHWPSMAQLIITHHGAELNEALKF